MKTLEALLSGSTQTNELIILKGRFYLKTNSLSVRVALERGRMEWIIEISRIDLDWFSF